ncbi:MAG: ABC transporter permease [Gemmatimonadaceae bacterium]
MKRLIDNLRNDWRYAVRSLRRRPGFTAVAALTLAIGIGANTAIFSVVHGVLLQPLPYNDSETLVMVHKAPQLPTDVPSNMSFPDLADIRDGSSFASVVGYSSTNYTLTEFGDPAIISVTRVTDGLMGIFRVAPMLGRDIRRDEFGANAPNVVVLSHAIWRERFGEDRSIVGKTIQLDRISFEVVGVAAEGFDYPNATKVWIPRRFSIQSCGRDCHTFNVIGRLATGATLTSARTELDRLAVNLEKTYPESNTAKRFLARDLKEVTVGNVKQALWIMLGAVALVLLIACANVANLLLARASAREGETAVRSALGATRGMLARQVFAESGALVVLGGALGVAMAFAGVKVLRAFAEGTIPRADRIAIDPIVLLVTLGTVVLVTFAFGLIPALTLSRATLADSLSQIGRGSGAGLRTVRFRRALLAGEVALSAALLIGAGLLLKTFAKLYAVDLGYSTQRIVRFNLVLPASAYPEIERVSQFYGTLESRIAALPGVASVGTMYGAPLTTGRTSGSVHVEGRPRPTPAEERDASIRPITPGIIRTIGFQLVRGRPLTDADNRAGAEPVALVNEDLVRQHFPNEDPIGRRIRVGVDLGGGNPYWRIVGIVRDARFDAPTREAEADIFMPHALFGPNSMTVHIRTDPRMTLTQTTLRDIVRALDPKVAIHRFETIEEAMGRQVAPTRLYLFLVAVFAITAALLAAVGLYGVMSYVVTQRTREIGIRVALGARREGVAALVVRQGMQPVVIGIAIGTAGAAAVGRIIEAVLFGVQPRDPFVVGGAAGLMLLVALAAAAVPALRASGIDPARVLHGE